MKNLLPALFLLVTAPILAQVPDTITQESEINNVTIFFTGAQISRITDLELPKGKHIILFNELPVELNPNSIQVDGINNCKILSVKHDIKHNQPDDDDPRIKKLEDEIEQKNKRIDEISDEISVYNLEETLLMDNRDLSRNDEGSSIAEIKEAADYYRERLLELRKLKQNLRNEYEDIKEEILGNYTEINKIFAESGKTYSQVAITIECEKEINTDMIYSYYITSAGWEPTYDFRVNDITKPLNITYKANVYQSSGEDWENADITLSTSNPVLTGSAPELQTWYLSYYTNTYDRVTHTNATNGSIRGTVYDDETYEPIPFANIALYQNGNVSNGTMTDFEGQYVIKPVQAGNYELECSYVGYNSHKIPSLYVNGNTPIQQDIYLNSSMMVLAECQVVDYKVNLIDKEEPSKMTISSEDIQRVPGDYYGYTSGGNSGYDEYDDVINGAYNYEKSKSKYTTTNYISSTVKNTVANLEYKIDIPYTIPSDGKNYDIKIKDVELDVEYIYHAVPKVEEEVFLSAQITDWTDLNLLSGESSIYYNGTFTGESYIDVNIASDTLDISLGRDKNIIIKREGIKEINDAKIIGNNVTETIGWNISIKNNKNTPIRIVVEDQFPVSTRKSVEVEQLEWSGGDIDQQNGKITWELNVESKELKEIKTSYSVKYHKSESIAVE